MKKKENGELQTISLDGVDYVRKDSVDLAPAAKGMAYCVVRTYSAGVHIGYVAEFGTLHNKYAKLINSRRLFSWEGACSLSQVAMEGVSSNSRLAIEVPEIELSEAIEVIPCSEKARKVLMSLTVWKK